MAKRRANREGSIRKRSDGRWEGRYTAGRDPNTGNINQVIFSAMAFAIDNRPCGDTP